MEVMNLSPRGIREHLKLNRPIFARTSALWSFWPGSGSGRRFCSWEKTDLSDTLRSPCLTGEPCEADELDWGTRRFPVQFAGSTDAAAERRSAQGRSACLLTRSPVFSITGRRPWPRGMCFQRRPAKSGLRSDSGPASISSSRRRPIRMLASSAVRPFRNGVCRGARRTPARKPLQRTPAARRRPKPPLRRLQTPSFSRVFVLYPDPLAKAAPPQASRRGPEHDRRIGAGHVLWRGTSLRHRHRRLCRVDAGALSSVASFPLGRKLEWTVGVGPGPSGAQRAMRLRPRSEGRGSVLPYFSCVGEKNADSLEMENHVTRPPD